MGRRLRQRRIALGISQEQLGAELGLTFQQVQKYEKGQNRISAGRLHKLGLILSVPVQYFFEGLVAKDAGAGGQPRAPGDVDVQTFLASPEGYALAAGFMRITDTATRRRIIDLVNTIAGDSA